PIDECGGCPAGQECQPTGIVCKKAPCPTHKCVLDAPIRPCTLFCVKGLRCVVRPKECPAGTLYCDKTPVPQCVPIKLGACPKINYNGIKPGVCLFDGTCNTDDDCSQFERCCETGCYEKKCVGVPVID
ncbi:keratin-associated protein 5-1, partial [Biomphalaria glabrata]